MDSSSFGCVNVPGPSSMSETYSALEQGQVGHLGHTANLGEEGLGLSTRLLSAYYTPVLQ